MNRSLLSDQAGRWFVLVGLVLLTGLGWHFGFRDLATLIQEAAPGPLGLMTLLILAGFWIRAWKWQLALGPDEPGIRLFFLAKTAGNWTPGRAGELAPLLLKRHRNARVAAWIGFDRIVEVAWTLGLGFAGLLWLELVPIWGTTLLTLASLAALGVVSFLQKRSATRVPEPQEDQTVGWRGRILTLAHNVWRELLLFYRKLPMVMLLTFLAKLTDVYAVVLLCEAFGYSAGLLLVCAARCAHGLVSAVPVTPDATGVPYVAAAWFLNRYAAIPYETLTAALALEVIVINAILWACFCLVSARRWISPSIG